MSVAERLTELRKEKGLTQAELAELADVSRQAVSKWETGEKIPSSEKLIKLSEIFAVPLDCLVKGDATLPEPQRGRQGSPSEKFYRGIIALLLAVIVLLTLALVIGHFSGKEEDEEDVIPIEDLREEKIVSTPESVFQFTWED